jgi:Uma2 family endonuclease
MMVPEVITRRKLTLADYEALPDDQDYEIIDGVLYMSPRPRPHHQVVANRLAVAITVHVERGGLGTVVPDADLIVDDRSTYISPDIMYFGADRYRSINPTDWIRTNPELVVEVLSPGTERYDLNRKRELYRDLRVPHYWIVDAGEHTVRENVLQPDGQYRERTIGPNGPFRPELFPELEIDLSRVFRD